MSAAPYFFRLSLLICNLLFFAAVEAQDDFIALQTESNQIYHLQWNGTDQKSSGSGFLVLTGMPKGTHVLTIGFPGYDEETSFRFTVTKGDQPLGFSLRQSITNNWSLFDMVSGGVINGTALPPVVKVKTYYTPLTDPGILADRKNAYNPLVKPSEQQIVKPAEPPMTIKKEEPQVIKPKFIRPESILKIFDKTGSEGIDRVYIIHNGSKTDTIPLFIPDLDKTGKPSSATSFFLMNMPPTPVLFEKRRRIFIKTT